MNSLSFDVTVLGAGPGGYVAAIRAAQLGKSVAIIEKEHLGGVCLNWGCIPTKALLKQAERYEFLQESEEWGFDLGSISVGWDRIIGKSRAAAEKLSGGVRFLMKKHKIQVIEGHGRFVSPNRLSVTASDGTEQEIQTTHAIIATGARPTLLPGVEVDGERVITSREAMVLPKLPDSLTVIGAGAIGLEFAYFYAAFGTKVTIVEYADRVLPSGDQEICDALARAFKKRGVKLHTSSKVESVRSDGASAVTRFEKNGKVEELRSDAALVAIGVKGNIEDLGLEAAGIKTERGSIPVDGYCQTNISGVYAIGDVIGPPALAHAASAEGLVAVHHLLGKNPEPIDHANCPACIYCQPQVASVGQTEAEAEADGREIAIGRFPFTANGKAVATGEAVGFVKLIADKDSGEILGAHIIGPEATELIGELTLARASELTIHDIHHTVHAHPTLSESVMEAAADWEGMATGI